MIDEGITQGLTVLLPLQIIIRIGSQPHFLLFRDDESQ